MKKINLFLIACTALVMSNAFAANFQRIQEPNSHELSPISLSTEELKSHLSLGPLNKFVQGTYKVHDWSIRENSKAIAKLSLGLALNQGFRNLDLTAVRKNSASVSHAVNSALRNTNIDESAKSLVERFISDIASTDNTDIYLASISDHFSAGNVLIIIDRIEHEVLVLGSYYNE